MEKEVAGMCFSGNLLDSYSLHVDSLNTRKISELLDLEQANDKEVVRVTGIVTSVTVKTTRKNEKMAFFSLEDKYGEIECLAFPTQYEKNNGKIKEDSALCVEGTLSLREDEDPKILLNRVFELVENANYTNVASSAPKQAPSAQAASVPKDNGENAQRNDTATAPKDAAKLYLRVPDLSSRSYLKAKSIVNIFEGNVKVIFYDTSRKEYLPYERGVDLSDYVYRELVALLGSDNVVAR
jgi:DNA polymerase-3 subunit alpha